MRYTVYNSVSVKRALFNGIDVTSICTFADPDEGVAGLLVSLPDGRSVPGANGAPLEVRARGHVVVELDEEVQAAINAMLTSTEAEPNDTDPDLQ